RIGDAKLLTLVIARGRHKRQVRRVGTPLHVDAFAAALDVVAQGGAMLVGRYLEACDAERLEVEDETLDGGERRVARQGILPRLELRMAHPRVDEIHVADAALVLL